MQAGMCIRAKCTRVHREVRPRRAYARENSAGQVLALVELCGEGRGGEACERPAHEVKLNDAGAPKLPCAGRTGVGGGAYLYPAGRIRTR
jgi:hypothetical protein